MFVLWTLIRVARLIDHHALEYELERFDKSPCIYYHNLGKTVLYSTDWNVVVYLPLGTTTNQLATLESFVGYTEHSCVGQI